ncbi:MAG: tetratricopeptide repeat protein [Deltaproteobacteria bacterium]|nr:tetratricopeptide repeat protein [Deltaproteobacteria bacterium]
MNERMIGPFRLMELRRSSLAGDVHVAWDSRLNERVLVTVIPKLAPDGPGIAGRGFNHFIAAMRRLSGLRNPLLLLPTEFASPSGHEAWYATEFAEGVLLRELISRSRKLPWRQAAMILHEMAAALAPAHGRGIAHGQLSPDHALLERTGRVVLDGFDVLARVAFAEAEDGASVDLVEVFEQPQYVAPENLLLRPPSLLGDVFSLGAVAYEMLTGAPPFASGAAILAHVQARRSAPDPTNAEDLPAAFRELVREMLSARAEQRPADAAAVRDRVDRLLREFLIHDVRASLGASFQRMPGVFGRDPATVGEPEQGSPPKTKARKPRSKKRPEPDGGRGDGKPGGKGEAVAASGGIPSELAAQLMSEPMSRDETTERSASSMALWLIGAMLLAGAGLAYALYGDQLASPAERGAREGAGTVLVAAQATPPMQVLDPAIPLAEPPPEDPVEEGKYKAASLLRSGKDELAETQALLALDEGGQRDPELLRLLAASLAEQGKLDEAVRAWLAADDADGSSATQGHLDAGFALAKAERCDAALPIFEEAKGRGLDSARLYTLIGNCQLVLGRNEEAVGSLRSAVERAPEDLDGLLPLALALSNLGKGAEASRVYERVLAIDPDNPQARRVMTRLEAVSGDPLRALAALRENAEGDEAATGEVAGRGGGDLELEAFAAFRAGRYGQAIDAYRRAIEAAGEGVSPAMLKNYAVALEAAGKAGEAGAAYRRAMAAAPGDAELPYLLGRIRAAQGARGEAMALYEDALRKGPDQSKVRFELGVLQLEAGRNEAAAKSFGVLARQEPGNLDVLQNLGKAQIEAGQAAEAVATFERMAELRPDDPGPVLTAAALMQRMGRGEEASAALQEACRRGAQEACE